MTEFKYVGSELDLFAAVRHWKSYWSAEMRRFIRGDVLEAGAGIGSNTRYLDTGRLGRFVCLEPDTELSAHRPTTSTAPFRPSSHGEGDHTPRILMLDPAPEGSKY